MPSDTQCGSSVFSCSSSGSSSPTKSPSKSPSTSEFGPGKYSSYQVTSNKAFADQDGSPPPPVLPPRNYRPAAGSGAAPTEHKFRPPPPQPPTSPPASYGGGSDMMGDFENTPQPDHYANQLRQQMRKQFSQSGGVGAARLQSKTLTEVKQSVAMSRPVDRPPVPQEAVAPPQPLPRAPVMDLNLTSGSSSSISGSDGHGYPDGTKSARELRETHKIDVIHSASGHAPKQQHQNQHHHQQQHHHLQQQQPQPHSHHQQQLHQPHVQTQSQPQHPPSNHLTHHHQPPKSHMQQSHSLTNISMRLQDPAGAARESPREQLRPLDLNRNSPKETPPTDALVAPPTGGDVDEELPVLPPPPPTSSPPPPEVAADELRKRLSFDDEGDLCSTNISSQR